MANTIKIGSTSYQTRKPRDLDAQLLATTGVSAAETARLLGDYAMPHHVAAALRPFLPEGSPPVIELASQLAGDVEVLKAVRALYGDPATVDAAPAAEVAANA